MVVKRIGGVGLTITYLVHNTYPCTHKQTTPCIHTHTHPTPNTHLAAHRQGQPLWWPHCNLPRPPTIQPVPQLPRIRCSSLGITHPVLGCGGTYLGNCRLQSLGYKFLSCLLKGADFVAVGTGDGIGGVHAGGWVGDTSCCLQVSGVNSSTCSSHTVVCLW